MKKVYRVDMAYEGEGIVLFSSADAASQFKEFVDRKNLFGGPPWYLPECLRTNVYVEPKIAVSFRFPDYIYVYNTAQEAIALAEKYLAAYKIEGEFS